MIVFAGPSLPSSVRPRDADISWRPPAQAGDLLRLLDDPPARVVLIDGLFDTRPAVTHKECIALMAAGTLLIGASSMGALRYAELAPFGMIGCGDIARAYRCGLLTGDDEVAVLHGDARIHWKAVTVPMVEVRATLLHCVRAGLIDRALARRLRSHWHRLHYSERDWPLMIECAEKLAERAVLETISRRHVPLKQRDALAALAAARKGMPTMRTLPPPQTRWLRQLAIEINARPKRP